jgi:pilus assembly protein CpaB
MALNSKLLSKLTSPLALLLFAALLAGGVAWVAQVYLKQREEAIKNELVAGNRKKQTPKVSVIVPKADAGLHTVLNTQMFVSRTIEEDLAYPDAIKASDFPAVEGQKLARPVLRGRPVRLSDLQVPEVRDVAAVVPAGRRAMTIDIDNLNSIAQTLRPNHRVDVFLMSKAPKDKVPGADDKPLEQATLFMQNMVILATGKEFADVTGDTDRSSQMVRPGEVQGASERDKNFSTVTLLVTPAEAARLLLGQKMGSYRVVLRGQKDLDPLHLPTVHAGDLMPRSADRPDRPAIEMIVGGRGEQTVSRLPVSDAPGPEAAASNAQPTIVSRAAR